MVFRVFVMDGGSNEVISKRHLMFGQAVDTALEWERVYNTDTLTHSVFIVNTLNNDTYLLNGTTFTKLAHKSLL